MYETHGWREGAKLKEIQEERRAEQPSREASLAERNLKEEESQRDLFPSRKSER